MVSVRSAAWWSKRLSVFVEPFGNDGSLTRASLETLQPETQLAPFLPIFRTPPIDLLTDFKYSCLHDGFSFEETEFDSPLKRIFCWRNRHSFQLRCGHPHIFRLKMVLEIPRPANHSRQNVSGRFRLSFQFAYLGRAEFQACLDLALRN